MIVLLRNIELYTPAYIGRRDIIIAGEKIYKILECNTCDLPDQWIKKVDCKGFSAFPGLVDGHVHITGGGGESGFGSRISEINISDILSAGITTVVGLLGADAQSRCLTALYAKACALEQQGIGTFIYSGSYSVPIVTFTGDITTDLVLIHKVIGAGEIAISDHRSSYPDLRALLELASKCHLGGLLSGKAGLLHIHVGDGKAGLRPLLELLDQCDLPLTLFLPTHVNRNPVLFEQAMYYAKRGGYIDLTSGEEIGIPVPDALVALIAQGVDLSHVSISSDANGSTPSGSAGKIQTLYEDVFRAITDKNIPPQTVIPLVTENAARRIQKYPAIGGLFEGSFADILVTDPSFRIAKLFCKGSVMVDNGQIV